jgi:hypothetical protein
VVDDDRARHYGAAPYVETPPATDDDRPRRPSRVALAIAAAVTLGVAVAVAVVALGGDDDGPRTATRVTGTAPAGAGPGDPLPPGDPLERRIAAVVAGAGSEQREGGDVAGVREARVLGVECAGRRCVVDYTVGVPGIGRIREQQARMLERIYDEPQIRVVVLRAGRRNSRDPVDQQEETPIGAEIAVTTCDRDRQPRVDWARRSGFEILGRICRVAGEQREGPLPGGGGPPGGSPPGQRRGD